MMYFTTGEACGLAMGLVMLGSKSATAIEEMVGVSSILVSCHSLIFFLLYKLFLEMTMHLLCFSHLAISIELNLLC